MTVEAERAAIISFTDIMTTYGKNVTQGLMIITNIL